MDKIIDLNGYQVAFRKDTPDEQVIRPSTFLGDKSVDFFYKLKEGDTAMMVGAYIGLFTIYASSRVVKGRVYALEPEQDNFRLLNKNIELNGIKNIVVDNLAVGKNKGKIRLYQDENSVGHTTMPGASNNYEEVEQTTLDEYFKMRNIAVCDLLKINCEGAEFEIFENISRECLKKIKNMVISYHIDKAPGNSEQSIIKKLKENGFKAYDIRRRNDRGWVVAYQKPCMSRLWLFYKTKIRFLIEKVRCRLK